MVTEKDETTMERLSRETNGEQKNEFICKENFFVFKLFSTKSITTITMSNGKLFNTSGVPRVHTPN